MYKINPKMASRITISLWSFILLSYLCTLPSISALPLGNESDKLSLLAIKDMITEDPLNVMTSWNHSLHHCDWLGVSCSRRHPGRVTILNLQGKKLTGSLPPHVGNLTFLKEINLGNNTFRGEIPQEIGRLIRLKLLILSNNGFKGEIPRNLSNCPDLQIINLDYNSLTGEIPVEFSFLLRLTSFSIFRNNITGTIPQWLGNASLLIHLSMGYNNLQGTIPPELGKLSKLRLLQLGVNNLSGTIPPTIYNLSSLFQVGLAFNQLHGELPLDIGFSLPNLERFYLPSNDLSGQIPVSLPNASKLKRFDFGKNHFRGTVPLNLGSLGDIVEIRLAINELETVGFLTALTNCTNLKVLDVSYNRLEGKLPVSITNLSTRLELLALGNQISGTIPEGIDNLVSMTQLVLSDNYISGVIPSSIGNLGRLVVLYLDQNRLSAAIPASLGNITGLSELYLSDNNLEGTIPPSLGNCHDLEILDFGNNLLTGTIPKEVVSISSMTMSFNLSNNFLTGPLPPEVGNMSKLVHLDISRNRLSGEIPITLAKCIMLNELLMQNNLFEGHFPLALSTLRSLGTLDLSNNNLSGQIPVYLQNITFLQYLNLSFNKLEGEVPLEGVFSNLSAFAIVGNRNLCGGIKGLGLPKCEVAARTKRGLPLAQKVAIPVAILCSLLLASFFGVLFWTKKTSRKRSTMLPMDEQFQRVSYIELLRATNGFSLSNLIGEGGYGSVYRGILGNDGTIVAVKVLNLKQKGAAKSFTAECNALKNTRHRNLIRIITSCSSIDSKDADFKALVYEYMPNGSLEEWLHHSEDRVLDRGNLSLAQKLSIAIDVAAALEYLHFHCQSSIIHGDLKPSNVLLDNDINARVGDFGLARFQGDGQHDNSSQSQTSSTWIKGTVGYVAPEYGMGGQVSTLGDVYSYGILLLEIFTGRRPTDELFKDSLNLHNYVKQALPYKVMEIVEKTVLYNDVVEEDTNRVEFCNDLGNEESEFLDSVLQIGVVCSAASPQHRMNMREVVTELISLRDTFLGTARHENQINSLSRRTLGFV